MSDEMIYLGYDIRRQQPVARYKDQMLVCQESKRATEIMNNLCVVGRKLPKNQPVSCGQRG